MKTLQTLAFSLLIGSIGVQTAFAVDMGGLGAAVAKDAGNAMAGQVASGAPLKFGIRTGLNLGKIETGGDRSREDRDGGYYYKSERTSNASEMTGNLIGFQVGAVLDIRITDFFYIQPGVMFSSKGGETETKYESTSSYGGSSSSRSEEENIRINPYYIDVPIMLSLKGTLADNLALRAHVGPYFGFGLFGEYEYENSETESSSQGDNDSEKIKVKNVFSPTAKEKEEIRFEGFNRFNFGIGFGGGIEISGFYLGVSYNWGLTNLYKNSEIELYEHTVSFILGYDF